MFNYDEDWSPLRIGIGLVVLIVIIIVIYWMMTTGMVIYNQYSEQKKMCMDITPRYANFLAAISQNKVELCIGSHDPIVCNAVITGNVNLCPDLSPFKEDCVFAITKDVQYCRKNPAWCQAIATDNPSLCDQVPTYLRTDCVADVTKNAHMYTHNIVESCKEVAWEEVATIQHSTLLCKLISDQSRQQLCIDDIKSGKYY